MHKSKYQYEWYQILHCYTTMSMGPLTSDFHLIQIIFHFRSSNQCFTSFTLFTSLLSIWIQILINWVRIWKQTKITIFVSGKDDMENLKKESLPVLPDQTVLVPFLQPFQMNITLSTILKYRHIIHASVRTDGMHPPWNQIDTSISSRQISN